MQTSREKLSGLHDKIDEYLAEGMTWRSMGKILKVNAATLSDYWEIVKHDRRLESNDAIGYSVGGRKSRVEINPLLWWSYEDGKELPRHQILSGWAIAWLRQHSLLHVSRCLGCSTTWLKHVVKGVEYPTEEWFEQFFVTVQSQPESYWSPRIRITSTWLTRIKTWLGDQGCAARMIEQTGISQSLMSHILNGNAETISREQYHSLERYMESNTSHRKSPRGSPVRDKIDMDLLWADRQSGIKIAELAEKYECSKATIHNYLRRIRDNL